MKILIQPSFSSASLGNWDNGSAPQGSSRCARTHWMPVHCSGNWALTRFAKAFLLTQEAKSVQAWHGVLTLWQRAGAWVPTVVNAWWWKHSVWAAFWACVWLPALPFGTGYGAFMGIHNKTLCLGEQQSARGKRDISMFLSCASTCPQTKTQLASLILALPALRSVPLKKFFL